MTVLSFLCDFINHNPRQVRVTKLLYVLFYSFGSLDFCFSAFVLLLVEYKKRLSLSNQEQCGICKFTAQACSNVFPKMLHTLAVSTVIWLRWQLLEIRNTGGYLATHPKSEYWDAASCCLSLSLSELQRQIRLLADVKLHHCPLLFSKLRCR